MFHFAGEAAHFDPISPDGVPDAVRAALTEARPPESDASDAMPVASWRCMSGGRLPRWVREAILAEVPRFEAAIAASPLPTLLGGAIPPPQPSSLPPLTVVFTAVDRDPGSYIGVLDNERAALPDAITGPIAFWLYHHPPVAYPLANGKEGT